MSADVTEMDLQLMMKRVQSDLMWKLDDWIFRSEKWLAIARRHGRNDFFRLDGGDTPMVDCAKDGGQEHHFIEIDRTKAIAFVWQEMQARRKERDVLIKYLRESEKHPGRELST